MGSFSSDRLARCSARDRPASDPTGPRSPSAASRRTRLVTHAHSGADGRFTVRLRAGRYKLVPSNGVPFPRASEQMITVEAHRFTSVTINFDSGIR